MATSTLSRLSKLIAESVATIEASCAARSVEVPSIDSAFTPGSEAFRMDPTVAQAINIVTASAYQIAALLEPPPHYKAIALGALLETNTVEILREAGRNGTHVVEIAKRNQLDPKKNARLHRNLSTYYMFREGSRMSLQTLVYRQCLTQRETPGQARRHLRHTPYFLGFDVLTISLDEGWMGATSAVTTLRDPKTRFSGDPTDAPLARTIGSNVPFWVWIEQPDQEMRLQRFGIAMQGVAAMQPAAAALDRGFDWEILGVEDVVVDVGAGVGAVPLALAKSYPSLKIVVQDRDTVTAQANGELPEAVRSGRVKLQGHDFYTPQPVKGASVFLLKQILHDWSDSYAITILK
ncbi:S-adenosyl-L-methionine-dependent methyltransferase [Stereum hirsutum FP-91666 SS1]|uniref:S-adenosyl-L-methionine-dependent methyltransferase n=1 Tax=Stereum hirsutum (strain FP-91666) TaxID=721885 RepID=R7RX40_STEHR|nr:S-adenosyl-L-methionine-dependent methyltransferase [Stereum hirsutum FP-91666 SS1]EIM79956.1 S-adenosyl-L-methionine-dependent methyltransferase [Stereum hirsutum FP-91666 SS1]